MSSLPAPGSAPPVTLPQPPSGPAVVDLSQLVHNTLSGSTSAYSYSRSLAIPFHEDDKAAKRNVIHRKASAFALSTHAPGAIVEYPQTGSCAGQRIAHIFAVDPADFVDPRTSFQFSFDKKHGGHDDATCLLLANNDGSTVNCKHWHGECSSVKTCSFSPIASDAPPPRIDVVASFNDAEKQLFLKTFAFFCALLNRGCTFSPARADSDELGGQDTGSLDCEDYAAENDCIGSRTPARSRCSGSLRLFSNDSGKYFVSCSLRSAGSHGHFFLHGVEQYDVQYLRALFSGDNEAPLPWEQRAAQGGYGPLVPCNRVASASSQAYWSDWHRLPGQALERAEMVTHSNCTASCDMYTPYDLAACPFVAIVCTGPHSHPPPSPVKTPILVRRAFERLLRSLDWRIANITPRRLVLNPRFVYELRTLLGWTIYRDPQLSDLHPSLGNMDHASYLIGIVRQEVFPEGTGFNVTPPSASVHQMQRENALERSLRYVRAVESVQVNGKTFRFVLCMFPEQSRALQQAKRITADSAFKRVVGWKEFEIETWDDSSMRSITCARVFMDSLTADAYLLVLKRIYQTVLSDCDEPWQFSYLHGRGTDTSTTDQDNAEALAFGQFLQWITSNTLPPSSPFHSLTAYQHLAHVLTLCITHHKRNLQPFKTKVSAAVFDAMQSLASPEPLPDINATFTTIRSGGKAASDWLANKLSGDAWALRALYRPLSNIPLVKWRAAPRTTNGNEQAHHNVNLDGTRLSLLAGIMHGADFDRRLLESRRAVADSGVSTRYKVSDEFLRAERGLARHVRSSNKQLDAHDATITEHSEALKRVNEQMKSQAQTLTAAPTFSAQASSARKRLRELHDQLPAHEERLRKAGRSGSGSVSYDIASEPSFDLALLKTFTSSSSSALHSVWVSLSPATHAHCSPFALDPERCLWSPYR
ncbi:hypothetical protein EXIGLDRAFT_822529 [Exidia glandulosa HHB12029]|uniref:Uncharacterized protein n=1 Tax=Exidia glandulosa HHB12029 TaxID=1314781 RepID=A0A165JDD9_EXIGL|nr:hypothetical protein EXIGLDRAFT_822529 [Exidia glandulosa HHB12029]